MAGRTAAHRTGRTSVLGKGRAEFPKFKGPEEVHDILTARAARMKITLAELMRELAIIAALGRESVDSLYRERLDLVEGKGEERG